MCRGGRLVADFTAGAGTRPHGPTELDEHLTVTADGQWVVWAYKLARPQGELFVPLTGGPGYPVDARARCKYWDTHDAPDPGCSCGFHALSDRTLPGLPTPGPFAVLTVALSGRVLAFDWRGRGVLWRAERQTVVRVEQPDWSGWETRYGRTSRSSRAERVPRDRRRPDDPDFATQSHDDQMNALVAAMVSLRSSCVASACRRTGPSCCWWRRHCWWPRRYWSRWPWSGWS